MGHEVTPNLTGYLPRVAAATLAISVCPILVVWGLAAVGVLQSTPLSVALVLALSLGASYLGGAIWRSQSHSDDLLFSELMLWGWIRRWWTERRLASALELLKGVDAGDDLSRGQRKDLLTQLAAALEARDPYTHGHSRRVARHAAMIAKGMHLSSHEIAKVRAAAILHDVGKIDTPRAVLNKPGSLTDAEFDVIKLHSVRGAEMVDDLGDAELTAIVRHHHERLDGTGYPDRLRGEDIPLGARIIAVADTFDAITSTRPYRPARAHKVAIEILASEAGTQLDPGAVHAFHDYYSGRRPLAVWLTVTNVPGRLLAWLTGGSNVAAATSIARVMATTAITGAAVTAAVHSPLHLVSSRASATPHTSAWKAPTTAGTNAGGGFASSLLALDTQRAAHQGGSAARLDRSARPLRRDGSAGNHHGSGSGSAQGSGKGGGAGNGSSTHASGSHGAGGGSSSGSGGGSHAPGNGHGHAYGLTGGNGQGLGAGQGNGHAYGQTGGNGVGIGGGVGGGQGHTGTGGGGQIGGGQGGGGQGGGGGNGHSSANGGGRGHAGDVSKR